MQKFHNHYSTKSTPQDQPIPGRESEMVKGHAGGFVFPVDDWTMLNRFLILGTEGGSYYATEQKMTIESAQSVARCIKADGIRTVKTIVEISDAGRAPKNGPALFALAMCSAMGDQETKKIAFDALPKVARIGTHLFNICEYRKAFAGWGRGWRNAVSKWYTEKDVERLAYQLIKYRQRDGWSHTDVLRLSHPSASGEMNLALGWATGKIMFENGIFFSTTKTGTKENKDVRWVKNKPVDWSLGLKQILGFEIIQRAENKKSVIAAIKEYKLPWETVPTQHLAHADVWETLLPGLPINATIRNLGRMSANGLLSQGSQAVKDVVAKLSDEEAVMKSRLHPIAALSAMKIYGQGHGGKGKLTWKPVRQICDALDDLFYASFGNVEPIGKPICLALDVSGSMSWSAVAGVQGLDCRMASAAMAMVTARVEKDYEIMGFSSSFVPLDISPKMRLDTVLEKISNLPFSATDCAIPMIWASGRNATSMRPFLPKRASRVLPFDAFVIYTDSETWCGEEHPTQALQRYRSASGRPAKLVVVGMVGNQFSIADPKDAGTMDVVGFDTAAPNIISNFIRG